MAVPPMAGLEIGTSRTVVCVGEMEKSGKIRILGYGAAPTIGVRKGQIVDLEQARVGVAKAVKEATANAQVNVWQVLLAVAGGHVEAKSHAGEEATRARDRVVQQEDIEAVREKAQDIVIAEGREMLHTLDQAYVLDGQTRTDRPEKQHCTILRFHALGVHCLKNHVNNARSVAKSENLDVTDVTFAGVCAAKAVLTQEQKDRGVVLIDLGGGTTSYIAFAEGFLATAGCIAVGGDHVTRDIAAAFDRLGISRAEELKCKEGSATVTGAENESPRIMLKAGLTDLGDLSINRRALNKVINARMDELFCIVREKLAEAGVLSQIDAGVVLTGGGAYLRNVTDLARRIFGVSCEIGVPQNVAGLESAEMPAALATAAGLVVYGYEAYKDPGFFGVFRNLFRKGS